MTLDENELETMKTELDIAVKKAGLEIKANITRIISNSDKDSRTAKHQKSRNIYISERYHETRESKSSRKNNMKNSFWLDEIWTFVVYLNKSRQIKHLPRKRSVCYLHTTLPCIWRGNRKKTKNYCHTKSYEHRN